ncbi:MAG: eukaryotic-like serine/threonine-protein kinase [Acidobacteriota bacterium]|nr:eukaryotic-like serine/threonine-protein kinase [Acidobacteriota bacterium]
MLKRSILSRLVPALAAFKLVLGLVAFVITYEKAAALDRNFPYAFYGLLAGGFGLTAALLLLGGRGDRRAQALGGFFLVTATAWCNKPLSLASTSYSSLDLFSLADGLELDAFMAWFLWRFVRDFPQPPVSLPVRRRIQILVRLSAAAGVLLFVINLIKLAVRYMPQDPAGTLQWLAGLTPQRGEGIYYSVVLGLSGAAFCLLLWRAARTVRGPEQRRARLFLQLLAFTLGPAIIEVLLELFAHGYHAYLVASPRRHLTTVILALLPLLTLPFTMSYAVLVHHLLNVRLIARRALQYLLARYSVLAVVMVPLAVLAGYVYVHIDQKLSDMVSAPRVPFLISVIAIGAAGLHYRRQLLDSIDRRFFREQYDARRILTLLVDRIRSIKESAALANLVSREIDLALHLEGISLMVLDPRSGMLADPRNRARKLDASSQLALTVSDASDPLEVDLENPQSPLLKLPEKERHWLVDSGFRLLVPILARDGSLLGLVGLGEKKSGLPFLREDRELLHAIASSAAWVLELDQERSLLPVWQVPPGPGPTTAPELMAPELARECPNCGALHPSYTVFCSSCSRKLELSRVPFVLPGKFRFERRVGIGGMGIVYQGSDLSLGRQVAIKTLRSVSPEDAMRLRREARTAAAVSHPHLAPVYGMETWKGTPMLVMELLEGGTLAQRVFRDGLPAIETVELGIAMAEALAQLHAADILHRDIKPSNIGYTRDGVPKLMDFGIARVIFELRDEEGLEEDDDRDLIPGVAVWPAGDGSGDLRHRFVGTLSYLSPEALRGDPADASFDLWGLCVVLYECLLGRKVFSGTNEQVAERVRSGRVPDFAQVCPGHGPALAGFFREALHRTPSRRPATACELRRRLQEVRANL